MGLFHELSKNPFEEAFKKASEENKNLELNEVYISIVVTYLNHIVYHIVSYHIAVLKRQNCLKVGTDKPKLKVKMQSVSDDDVQKRLLEQPHFELAVKGVFRLGRCYIFWQGVPGLWASNRESTTTDS